MARRTETELKQHVRRFNIQNGSVRLVIPHHPVSANKIVKGTVTWHNYIDPKTKKPVIGMEIGGRSRYRIQKSGTSLYVNVPQYIRASCDYSDHEWVYFVPMKKDPVVFFLHKTKKPPVPKAVRKD